MSHSNQSRQMPDEALINSMQVAGLLEEPADANFSILTGGITFEIWKVETNKKSFCVKRALLKCNVEAERHAPIERNSQTITLMPGDITLAGGPSGVGLIIPGDIVEIEM